MKAYYVYIATNRSMTLYAGVTNDLERRMYEHANSNRGFTGRYKIDILVFYEESEDSESAIAREKQIKNWSRKKKISLIESVNPEWKDLSKDPSAMLGAANGVRRA